MAPTTARVLGVNGAVQDTSTSVILAICYDRGGFPGDTLDRVRNYEVNAQELVMTSSTRLLMTT